MTIPAGTITLHDAVTQAPCRWRYRTTAEEPHRAHQGVGQRAADPRQPAEPEPAHPVGQPQRHHEVRRRVEGDDGEPDEEEALGLRPQRDEDQGDRQGEHLTQHPGAQPRIVVHVPRVGDAGCLRAWVRALTPPRRRLRVRPDLLSPSQVARSRISRSTSARIVADQSPSSWTASTRSTPASRSAVASSLPTSRSPEQDRHRPVAPAPLGGRLVHLQLVVELEQLGHPLAVVDQPVERGQQRRPAGERRRSRYVGIDAPPAPDALDDGGLTPTSPTSLGSPVDLRGLLPGQTPGHGADARRDDPPRLLHGHRRDRRGRPARPDPRAARDPCARRRPPRRAAPSGSPASGRCGRCSTRSTPTAPRGCPARRSRAAAPRRTASPGCPAGSRRWPATQSRVSTCQSLQLARSGPGRHLAAEEREVRGRAEHHLQLDQPPHRSPQPPGRRGS